MRTKNPTSPSLFFTIQYPPTSPDDPLPSDSQFTDFLHALASALPASTKTLYAAALANLAPDNAPELTSEMRASLTAAVTASMVHLPPTEGEGRLDFLRSLAAGDVRGKELVSWADTVTAALRAFGSNDYGGLSLAGSSRSATPPPPRATPMPIGRTCAITGSREMLSVGHVVPPTDRVAVFWRFLDIFLGAEAAEALRRATGVGEAANCIAMAVNARYYFDAESLEIVPVVGSWAGREYNPCVVGSYDISIPAEAALPLYQRLYSNEPTPYILSTTLLASGTTITLTTPDPLTMPLPHPLLLLLQLHAVCGRVKRLRAAAGWPVLQLGGESEWPETSSGWERWMKAIEEDNGEMEGEEGEVEEAEVVVVSAMARYGMVSLAEGVQGWLLGCCPPENVDPNLKPPVGIGEIGDRKDNKRKFGDIVEERKGEEGEEDRERPRKVTVVLDEVGMRERARWRLLTGRGGRRWLGV